MTKEAAQRSAMRRLALMKVAAPVVDWPQQPAGRQQSPWSQSDLARAGRAIARNTGRVSRLIGEAPTRGLADAIAAPITYFTHAPMGTSFDDWKRAYWNTAKQDYRQYDDDLRGLNADLGRAFRAGADRVAPPGAAGVPAGVVPPTAGIGRAIRGAGRYLNPRTYGGSPAAQNLRNAYHAVQNAGRNTVNTVAAPATYPIYAPPGTSYPDWQRQYWQGAGQP